jgi:hypothetical protein
MPIGGSMLLIALMSIGVFVSLGWIRRPSSRRTGEVLSKGLLEATLAPVQLMGAVVEIGAKPLRATGSKLRQVVDGGDLAVSRPIDGSE